MTKKLPYETLIRMIRIPVNLLEKCKDKARKDKTNTTEIIREMLDEAKHSYRPDRVLSIDREEKLLRIAPAAWQWLRENALIYGISVNELITQIIFKEFKDEM